MIVARAGEWLYGGQAPSPVDIVGLDFDFWYELGKADDQPEPGETPQPMGDGELLFYVRFRRASPIAWQ